MSRKVMRLALVFLVAGVSGFSQTSSFKFQFLGVPRPSFRSALFSGFVDLPTASQDFRCRTVMAL